MKTQQVFGTFNMFSIQRLVTVICEEILNNNSIKERLHATWNGMRNECNVQGVRD